MIHETDPCFNIRNTCPINIEPELYVGLPGFPVHLAYPCSLFRHCLLPLFSPWPGCDISSWSYPTISEHIIFFFTRIGNFSSTGYRTFSRAPAKQFFPQFFIDFFSPSCFY